jgi:hypothetical protein
MGESKIDIVLNIYDKIKWIDRISLLNQTILLQGNDEGINDTSEFSRIKVATIHTLYELNEVNGTYNNLIKNSENSSV